MKFDSSPMIYIIKIDLFEKIYSKYAPIRITNAIYNELVTQGIENEYNEAFVIANLIKHNRIEVQNDYDLTMSQISNLGKGEQTAIIEAYQEQEILIIDDKKARNRAIQMGIKVLGVDTLLLDLFFSLEVSYNELESYLKSLSKVMLLKGDKIIKILEIAREGLKEND